MGINISHKQLNYVINGVSLVELIKIVHGRCDSRRTITNDDTLTPTIDVDVSWMIRRLTNKSIVSRIGHIMSFCDIICSNGINVVLVCDGEHRYHTKQATISRQSTSYKNKINLYLTRCKIIKVNDAITACSDESEITSLKTEQIELTKKSLRLESNLNANNIDVGNTLFRKLLNEVQKFIEQNNTKDPECLLVLQAETQADYTIAYRLINNLSDIALMSDTDLGCLTGNKCLSIKSYRISTTKNRNSTLNELEIYCSHLQTMQDVCNILGLDCTTKNQRINIPSYPFFNIANDIRLRGIISVGLGCDVCIGGVFGVTVATFYKYLAPVIATNTNDNICDTVLNYFYNCYCSKLKLNKDDDNKQLFIKHINILVDALLYEPANFRLSLTKPFMQNTLYILPPPLSLHVYCEQFARDNSEIIITDKDIPGAVYQCVGSGYGSHKFLPFSDKCECISCDATLCQLCSFNHTVQETNNIYCVHCYMSEISVTPLELDRTISKEQMIKELSDVVNTELQQTDNLKDVMDIYDALIDNPHSQIYSPDLSTSIKYPLESSSYFEKSQRISDIFDISEGGRIISDNKLTTTNRITILHILSELVHFNNDCETDSNLAVIPSLIQNVAKGSRLHAGFRLCKRAVRHAMDPQCPSILKGRWSINVYNTTTTICIHHLIKASMKSDVYNVKLIISSKDLVCCTCSCKAGSVDKDRVVCVHILPVLYCVTQILFDGLATHFLGEFTTLFSYSEEQGLTDEERKCLSTYIARLNYATTNFNNNLSIMECSEMSPFELLTTYQVGTERGRFGPGPPRNIQDLGPFRLIDRSSVTAFAKRKIEKIVESSPEDNDNDIIFLPTNNISSKDYFNIKQLILCFYSKFKTSDVTFLNDFIGFQLLSQRMGTRHHPNPVEEDYNKKIVTLAIKSANNNIRRNEDRKQLNTLLERKRVNTLFGKYKTSRRNVEKPVLETVDNEIIDSKIPEANKGDPFVYIAGSPSSEKRKTCCLCSRTNTKFPGTKYFRVPKGPSVSNLLLLNNDYKRKNYFVSDYYRKEYLKRLNLPREKQDKSYLMLCQLHPMASEWHTIPWKSVDRTTQTVKKEIVLPMDVVTAATRTTRSSEKGVVTKLLDRSKETIDNTKQRNKRQQPDNERKKPPVIFSYCNFPGCKNKRMKGSLVKFHRLPTKPKYYESNRELFAIKRMLRRECLSRIGYDLNDDREDIRICDQHKLERLTRQVTWENKQGKINKILVRLFVPGAVGVESNMSTSTKKRNRDNGGVGATRVLTKNINEIQQQIEDGSDEAKLRWELAQVVDERQWEDQMEDQYTKGKCYYTFEYARKVKSEAKEETVLTIKQTTNQYIKDTTGFRSKLHMIAFICVITKGNLTLLFQTTSHLSWYEEWLFYFQMTYGKCYRRWSDAKNHFNKHIRILRVIFDTKLKIHLQCRNEWPKYVTLEEDKILRDTKWNEHYKNHRVIMWDNTALPIKKPSDPEQQRNTYSSYYAGNVAKGSVFVQLCGWLGTEELWVGAVSDSDYFKRSGILEMQERYLEDYDTSNKAEKWYNILDKGYKVGVAAWQAGGQLILQPSFARSNEKFTQQQIIYSAAVAADRSANERAVRICKASNFLSDGLKERSCHVRWCNVWLTWSFQANFMYRPVTGYKK